MVDKQCLNELALFAGAGGGILGGHLLGWRTVCAVEWEAYPASVLCARQNDGLIPPFPIWDDVQTFDGKPWRGIVDVISGGFPCQDISAAGKGAGIDGERSGMWGEMARIIHEVRPRFVFVENSPMLTSRGLGRVLGDLASMGFDARWGVLGAADVGANHQRDRIWIVGKVSDSNSRNGNWWSKPRKRGSGGIGLHGSQKQMADTRCELWTKGDSTRMDIPKTIGTSSPIFNQSSGEGCGENQVADTREIRPCGEKTEQRMAREFRFAECGVDRNWWQREPESVPRTTQRNMGGVADGVASRVDRLKAIGNGQVPLCVATAWRILSE